MNKIGHEYVRFSICEPWLGKLKELGREGESPSTTASRLLKACLELSPERNEVSELRERIAALEAAIAALSPPP